MSNHFNIRNYTNKLENRKDNKKEQKYILKPSNGNQPMIIKKYKKVNSNNADNNKAKDIKKNIKEEKIQKDIHEQKLQERNSSKKVLKPLRDFKKESEKVNTNFTPKTEIKKVNKSTKKSKNSMNNLYKNMNNINNDNVNFYKDENNEVNKFLKSKSIRKHNKKPGDYLKASININILNFDKSQNDSEDDEDYILEKNDNNNIKLFKIDEEISPNKKLKLKLKDNIDNYKEKELKITYKKNDRFHRSLTKKYTYQSQIFSLKDKPLFNKKKSINLSSKDLCIFGSSLKDSSIKRSTTLGNGNKNKNNSINNLIIPLLNQKKENNCFLNVIIQILTHLEKFKEELLHKYYENIFMKSKSTNEFYDLIKLYESEQIKNRDSKDKIEPILSVNNIRTSLNEIYHRYNKGESGDPMETMGVILDLLHEAYIKKNKIENQKIGTCRCIAHKHFFLNLADIQLCPNCNSKKVQLYDKDCFMYNVFINDVLSKLHRKSYNSFKSKLFQKLKESNETYDEGNKPKIPGCNCSEKLMESYEKTTKLIGKSSTYLIINITWAEEFPKMCEILKAYGLISVEEKINNLFNYEENAKNLDNNELYLKGFILYGIYHYVCAIYINDENKWAIVDDKTIKYIDNYYTLIDSFLRNHLMPVGIIYSKDENDSLNESIIKSMDINKDEYNKLYQFCYDVDKRRGLKSSELFQSKNNFDENQGDYFNNNAFFGIFDGSNDDELKERLLNSVFMNDDKEQEKKKEAEHKKKDDENNKNIVKGVFRFSGKFDPTKSIFGLPFENSEKEEKEKESNNAKEDNDWDNIGENYEDS